MDTPLVVQDQCLQEIRLPITVAVGILWLVTKLELVKKVVLGQEVILLVFKVNNMLIIMFV